MLRSLVGSEMCMRDRAKEEMIGASVMFSMSGVNKTRFIDHVKSDPQTYRDWDYGQWSVETTGKEDEMFSPFLRKPFEQAREAGLIPKDCLLYTSAAADE